MHNLLTDFVVKVLGKLLPFAIRWYYKPAKIAQKIKIQIRGSHEGVTFYGGELPRAMAWLEITNLSPFPLEIDRLHGNFWYGTQLAAFYFLKRCRIEPSADQEILIEAELTDAHSAYIKRNQGKMDTKLTLNAYILCGVNNIELYREIPTKNVRLVNFG